ncbi:Vacuolar protein sorting-associated protein 29 [Camellia lanceoleosa]|uniref:Vacuolar protein sorting-associated protein 29 n=1 Tax=Camellia lanceoleosa TaxID=1840588 RepID=A0ACC0IWQ1_9ERIC|nr:Vacuolar protein sorting-associated protein 29 [Camellia lanceoleosa]
MITGRAFALACILLAVNMMKMPVIQKPKHLQLDYSSLGCAMVIRLSHGGDLDSLAMLQRQLDVDILVSGHTHQFKAYKHEGGVVINPVSATGAYSSITYDVNPSFVLMDIDGLRVVVYAYELIDGEAKWHERRDHTRSGGLLNHGGGIHNGIYTHEETQIRTSTVSNPSLESKFKSGRKDIYAMPAFFNGTMYSARSDGFIYAVKNANSSVLWKKDLQKLTGLNATMHPGNGTTTVSAPTVACDLLIVGIYGPALVVAHERATGKLVWSTLLDSHPAAVVTMSGTFHKSMIHGLVRRF